MKKSGFVCLGAALLILLVTGIWSVSPAGTITSKQEYLIGKYYRFETLGEEALVQRFEPHYKKLDAIELFIANVYPETDGEIVLSVLDPEGKVIFEKEYRAASIPTGEFHEYKIGKKLKTGEIYEIRLSYTGTSEEKPQLMVSEAARNLPGTKEMLVNGEVSDHNMAITWHYSQSRLFWLPERSAE